MNNFEKIKFVKKENEGKSTEYFCPSFSFWSRHVVHHFTKYARVFLVFGTFHLVQ